MSCLFDNVFQQDLKFPRLPLFNAVRQLSLHRAHPPTVECEKKFFMIILNAKKTFLSFFLNSDNKKNLLNKKNLMGLKIHVAVSTDDNFYSKKSIHDEKVILIPLGDIAICVFT